MRELTEQATQEADFQKMLQEIVEKAISQGQLLIIATKRHGKTNSAMHIIRRLIANNNHELNEIKTVIFDTVLVWRNHFDKIPYIDLEDVRFLPMVQDLIVDVPYVDSLITRNVIGEIVMNDFIHKRKLKKDIGTNPYINVYVIEEIQNCLGTYSMNGNVGRFWLKVVSECGNYGQVIIGIGQRFADISTKVVDRTRYYLIGATSGERDLVKIKGIGGIGLREKIKTLKKGEFIFFDKERSETMTLIYFPEFKQTDKPYPYDVSMNGSGYVKQINLSG